MNLLVEARHAVPLRLNEGKSDVAMLFENARASVNQFIDDIFYAFKVAVATFDFTQALQAPFHTLRKSNDFGF